MNARFSGSTSRRNRARNINLTQSHEGVDTMRHSDLALVLIRLKINGDTWVVLSRHAKWRDWTLVGGHVESDEKNDWARAAVREADEELAPLRFGDDFILLPLLDQPVRWGPVPSRSAGGELTTYAAQLFALRFMKAPLECLARLPQDDFRIMRETELFGREIAAGGHSGCSVESPWWFQSRYARLG
jgi:hypothetical protein